MTIDKIRDQDNKNLRMLCGYAFGNNLVDKDKIMTVFEKLIENKTLNINDYKTIKAVCSGVMADLKKYDLIAKDKMVELKAKGKLC